MKYNNILALFVLLAGYIPSNVHSNSSENDDEGISDEEDLVGANEDTEWSVKNVSPGACDKLQGSTGLNKQLIDTHMAWQKSLLKSKKTSKTFAKNSVKNIKSRSLQPISDFAKMSQPEFNNLSETVVKVYEETIKTTIQTMELFNITVAFLQAALEDAASQISAEIYLKKMKEYAETSHTEVYCRVKSGDVETATRKAEEANRELLNLSANSGNNMTDIFKVQTKHIKKIASKGGEIIDKAAVRHIKHINSTGTTNEKVLKYISGVSKDIGALARETKEKCKEIASRNLKTLKTLIIGSLEALKSLGKAEVRLNQALAYSRTADIEASENEIHKLYKQFKQTSVEESTNFMKKVGAMIADSIEKNKALISMKLKDNKV